MTLPATCCPRPHSRGLSEGPSPTDRVTAVGRRCGQEDVGESVDVSGITHELLTLPKDPGAVCELIAGFLADWQSLSVGPGLGAGRSEVTAAEERLGSPLPVALRWLLSHAGDGTGVVGHQDPLTSPRRLAVDETGVLVYCSENQNCAQWGVRAADLGNPDPPVLWRDPGSAVWYPYQERLSVDLLEYVLSEVMLLPGSHLLQAELPHGVPGQLRELHRLAIPAHVFWPSPDGPPVEWYGMQDCLVRNDGGQWLWAFGRTPADLRRVTSRLPVDWDTADF